MILVDYRKGSGTDGKGNELLVPLIKKLGVECEIDNLEFADACFEGNGPEGYIAIGVERKTLHDLLGCIDTARYSAHQRVGMAQMYTKSFLALEGMWEMGGSLQYSGTLIQGFNGGSSWGPLKTRGNQTVLYSKLYRYLLSVQLSGVIITQSNNVVQTANNIVEIYRYFQKPWHSHTSMIETQKLTIPSLTNKPSLARKWAADLDRVGVTKSIEAAKLFKNGRKLALAGEEDWMRLGGVGAKTAIAIVKQIREDWA